MKKVPNNWKMDPGLKQLVEKQAGKENRSTSNFVETALVIVLMELRRAGEGAELPTLLERYPNWRNELGVMTEE